MLGTLSLLKRFYSSTFPKFQVLGKTSNKLHQIRVITQQEANTQVPESLRQQFKKTKKVSIQNPQNPLLNKSIYCQNSASKVPYISKDTYISFSNQFIRRPSFIGIASNIFAQGHKFSRKSEVQAAATIFHDQIQNIQYIIELAQAKIRSRQMADSRADQANPAYFQRQTARIVEVYKNVQRVVIKGDQLLKQGFRLMHAVGRASQNAPTFINLKYQGNPESSEWFSFVGKGVTFDSGGLNLKPSTAIGGMHGDKHGSTSVLSAFQAVVRLRLKVNLTVSLGYVQNFVSSNAYRPLDIIKSRKGITVQIGNTDAEGRLVLADCMNWTQQNYKVKEMIELSTLTGAIVIALGKKYAGMFGNNQQMMDRFKQVGKRMGEDVWHMPVDQYHHEIIKAKQADISNAPGKPEASSSQAAAFLQRFVENGVKWIHLDIAGVSTGNEKEASGYGARLLIDYLKQSC